MASPDNNPHNVIEKEDARAGRTGMHVRYILMISAALCVIALAAVWALSPAG